jgi:hypothetical protein
VVVETENLKALAGEKSIAAGVALLVLCFEMLATIDFDDKVCVMTNEIHDKWANRGLATETCAVHSMAPQRGPYQSFRIS